MHPLSPLIGCGVLKLGLASSKPLFLWPGVKLGHMKRLVLCSYFFSKTLLLSCFSLLIRKLVQIFSFAAIFVKIFRRKSKNLVSKAFFWGNI